MRTAPSHRTSPQALILLVDDNYDGVIARRYVLEELGYEVVTADCGSDALRIVTDRQCDLVVTDYRMSPTNGVELISDLRKRGLATPIILLSGFVEPLGLSSENTGADAVIQKNHHEVANLVRQTRRLLSPKKPANTLRKDRCARAGIDAA
jgi:CheY-like chemotaxis protein